MANLRYAEDFKAGDVFDFGVYEITREEIIEFSRKYDPFPFHIDEQPAQETIFGSIISSGWLTALVWLRLMHKSFLSYEATLSSPGHEEMVWPKPVRPGARLIGQVKIKESRISTSRPDLGFVRYTATSSNQEGDEVFVTTYKGEYVSHGARILAPWRNRLDWVEVGGLFSGPR